MRDHRERHRGFGAALTRAIHIMLLAAMLGLLLRLLVRGEYVFYVKPSFLPALIAAAVVLVLMTLFVAKDAWVAIDEGEGHDHGDHDGHGHNHGEPRAALLLALPLIVVLTVAPAPLGAFSAARSTGSPAPTARAFAPLPAGDPVEVGVPDFVARAGSEQGKTLVRRKVRLVGFVTPNPAGAWWLTRFVVSCCAADAISYRVLTRDGPKLEADTWVALTGQWVAAAGTPDGIPTLQVERHTLTQPPSNPYAQ